MALHNVLPIDPVVNIVVNLSTVSAARKAFNLALLVGDVDTANVPDFADSRFMTYDSLDSMLQAGFTTEDRLYKAASLIFGQAKTPPEVAIGNKKGYTVDVAGSNTYTVITNAVDKDTVVLGDITLTAGTDFVVGTTSAVTATNIAKAFNANGTFNTIYTASAKDSEITVTENTPNGGNTPGAMTTTGTISVISGTPVDSTSRAETPVETFQNLRAINYEWYAGIYCDDLTNAELLECAAYFEACTPDSIFCYTTSNEADTKSDGGIFGEIKSLGYRRSFGQYSTSHPDAIAAIVGWAMGAMSTKTIGSAYSVAYKSEVGVQAENYMQVFSTNMVNNIKNNYGNVYINRGTYYNVFEEGRMGDGSWFDEIIYLDKYKNEMQLAIMDLLVNNNKIPQTEAGMTRIKNAIKVVCDEMGTIGFIKDGKWLGSDLLDLSYGDTLPGGYLIQSEAIADQSQSDRDARIAPPIYVSLKLAGAIHHVTVQVDVNR